jgi:hypothetical protein
MRGKEVFMKGAARVFAITLVLLVGSCATTGQFKPVSEGERVIGTVQTTFTARDPWLDKKDISNAHVYIKLLEAAAQKYSGEIDVRDIVWATGRYWGGINVEISAAGKVVRPAMIEAGEAGNADESDERSPQGTDDE